MVRAIILSDTIKLKESNIFFPEEHISVKLKHANVSIISNDDCWKTWRNILNAGSLCAVNPTDTPCHGDSGGPLVIKRNNKWVQVGITSYAKGKCEIEPPVVY